MEESECASDHHSCDGRESNGCCDEQSQNENGGCDALLNCRDRDASHPDQTANDHQAEKSGWYFPARAPAKLARPQARCDHGQQMIETGDRMRKSICEAGGRVPGMSLRERWREEESECNSPGQCLHVVV